jgi:hypothetical protein
MTRFQLKIFFFRLSPVVVVVVVITMDGPIGRLGAYQLAMATTSGPTRASYQTRAAKMPEHVRGNLLKGLGQNQRVIVPQTGSTLGGSYTYFANDSEHIPMNSLLGQVIDTTAPTHPTQYTFERHFPLQHRTADVCLLLARGQDLSIFTVNAHTFTKTVVVSLFLVIVDDGVRFFLVTSSLLFLFLVTGGEYLSHGLCLFRPFLVHACSDVLSHRLPPSSTVAAR